MFKFTLLLVYYTFPLHFNAAYIQVLCAHREICLYYSKVISFKPCGYNFDVNFHSNYAYAIVLFLQIRTLLLSLQSLLKSDALIRQRVLTQRI